MRKVKQSCLEAGAFLALATIVGLTVNALRREGVDLSRDYAILLPEHGFQTVTLKQAYDYYEFGDSSIVFIDARSDDHYQECRIPGAYQFNYYHPERYLDEVLTFAGNAEVVIIYCNGGDCEDSLLTAQYLTMEIDTPLDFDLVYVFEGGLIEWRKANHPTEGENCEQ